MKNKNLGKFNVSEIAYGMWRIVEAEIPAQELVNFINQLYELKINIIDTASIYGGEYHKAESKLGEAIKLDPSIKEKFTIVSKCGIEVRSDVNHYDNTYDYIIDEVKLSLKSLNIETLDVFLLHRPDLFMDYSEVYRAFEYLKDNNMVSEFGVSNYTPIQFDSLNKYLSKRDIYLVTNQIEINPYQAEHYDNDNVFYLKGEEISPMIWSPMAGGELFKDNAISQYIEILVKKYKVSKAAIAMAYITSQGLNPVVILGSHNLGRYHDAIMGLDIILTSEEKYTIMKNITNMDVR